MSMITKAAWDDDYNVLHVTNEEGVTTVIDCDAIESDLHNLTMASRSRLAWLAEHDPLDYARMAVGGELSDYVDTVNADNAEQSNNLREWLGERRSDMGDAQVECLVREFMMYDS